MATVSAGSINLTANLAVESGHHVATIDTTRSHVSDIRKPVSVGRREQDYTRSGTDYVNYPQIRDISNNILVHGNTVYGIKTPAQIIDYKQYNWFHNQYVDDLNYIETFEDYVKPLKNREQDWNDNEQAQYNLPWGGPLGDSVSPGQLNYFFDFADYIGLQNCTVTVYYDITVRSDTNASAQMKVRMTASGNGGVSDLGATINPPSSSQLHDAGTTTASASLTFTGTGAYAVNNGQGFIAVGLGLERSGTWDDTDVAVGPGNTNQPQALISNVRASIQTTGRTRINTSNVSITTAGQGHDTVSAAATNAREDSIVWSGFDFSGVITPGAPHIYGIATHTGIMELYDDSYLLYGINYPMQIGEFHDQTHDLIRDAGIDKVELIVRHNDSDIHVDSLNTSSTDGTAQDGFILGSAPWQSEATGGSYTVAVRDIPAVASHVTLTAGNVSISQSANVEIEYRYVRPIEDKTLPNFMQARLLLNPPFLAQDIDYDMAFAVTSSGNLIVSDLQTITTEVDFATDFVGGIQQLGVSEPAVAFALDSDNTGLGVIIDGGTVDFAVTFTQAELYELSFAYSTDFKGNQRHQPAVNLQWNITQSYDVTAVGVIIDNAETETFRFGLNAVPLVFVIPDRYRELLLTDYTRVYPTPEETRDHAVNSQTRRYPVPAETRDSAVDLETRTITEKGY